ncbi:MAG: DUF427 domain-containing protein [Pirellulales bacterium]|nr:DUF427 domain-containing protein [Pirellulales bacterium]
MPKAIWKDAVIAESDHTEIVDGNHYFPPHTIKHEFFEACDAQTVCGWKGTASYYHVVVGDEVNEEAAWYYAEPKDEAANIRGHVAFWKGVVIEE